MRIWSAGEIEYFAGRKCHGRMGFPTSLIVRLPQFLAMEGRGLSAHQFRNAGADISRKESGSFTVTFPPKHLQKTCLFLWMRTNACETKHNIVILSK